VAALGLLAAPAWAVEYTVKAKASCADASGGTKLEKVTGDNTNIISLCVGISSTDPVIDDYAVTFDSSARELHVVLRCNGAIVCDLTDLITCQTAGVNTKGAIDTKALCTYRMLDIGMSNVEGTLLCKERELFSAAKDKYAFSTSCVGSLASDSTPCALALKSDKPFEQSGICPASAP
jgi:hypothetical protein